MLIQGITCESRSFMAKKNALAFYNRRRFRRFRGFVGMLGIQRSAAAGEEKKSRQLRKAAAVIYAIRSGKTANLKFGYTKDVGRRLKGLQTGHAARLHLMASCDGSLRLENHLHFLLRRFLPDEYALVGEWYLDCDPVQQVASAIASGTLSSHLAELEKIVSGGDKYAPPTAQDPSRQVNEKTLMMRLSKAGLSYSESFYLIRGGIAAMRAGRVDRGDGLVICVTEPVPFAGSIA